MHHFRRVSAVLATAALLGAAGCWNPTPEKYPSITFFGADYGTITAGTDGAGNPVQGSVTLTWQTRLAEKVNIVATPASTGKPSVVATFKAGDTAGCTVNPTFPDSDCVKDGTYQVSPTEDTVYNIQAIVGAGDCSRDPTLGNLLHPAQCNDLTADPNASLQVIPITVVAPSTISLTVGGSDTATVAPGTDVMADYAVTGATAYDFGILSTDSSGNPSYAACGAAGDTTAPCTMPAADANGNVPDSGQITVPGVTASTVLTGESTNGADDGLGDVAPDTTGATVTITVPGTPAVGSFTATPDHINPTTSGTSVTLDWTVTSADTVAVQVDSSSTGAATGMSSCTGVDNTGAGTCFVSVTGADGDMVKLNLVASNSATSQTSPPSSVTVMIGATPTATFSASPTELTSAGGDVTLTWSAAGATGVTITDDGGNTVVDTGASTPTNCDSGNPCDPTGDTITVAGVTATTTWTLTAQNAFPGSTTKTATSTVYGAPALNALTVQDSASGSSAIDVSGGGLQVVNTTDSATLAWDTTNVKPSTVTFNTAAVPATGGCAAVPSWSPASGFSFTGATGTFGLTTTGNLCYQFVYGGYASQAGGTVTFEVDRKVAINQVTLNSQGITNDSKTAFVQGASVTADWSNTSNAASYVLAKSAAVGTGVNCSAAPAYTAVGGYTSPATTYDLTSPVTGTTDCYRLTAVNNAVSAPDNQAVFYFGITGQ